MNTLDREHTLVCRQMTNSFRKEYYTYRLLEFLENATTIMRERLEPGKAKTSARRAPLFLGECPFDLLFTFLQKFNSFYTRRTYYKRLGTSRTATFRHYFKFVNSLPDLRFSYHVKDHGFIEDHNVHCRSMYTSITFILLEDNRVLFHSSITI